MDLAGLTASEREVLALVSDGLTNGEIGTRMAISSRTVQGHLVRLFTKLGVNSRTGLAALAGRGTTSEYAEESPTRVMARADSSMTLGRDRRAPGDSE